MSLGRSYSRGMASTPSQRILSLKQGPLWDFTLFNSALFLQIKAWIGAETRDLYLSCSYSLLSFCFEATEHEWCAEAMICKMDVHNSPISLSQGKAKLWIKANAWLVCCMFDSCLTYDVGEMREGLLGFIEHCTWLMIVILSVHRYYSETS